MDEVVHTRVQRISEYKHESFVDAVVHCKRQSMEKLTSRSSSLICTRIMWIQQITPPQFIFWRRDTRLTCWQKMSGFIWCGALTWPPQLLRVNDSHVFQHLGSREPDFAIQKHRLPRYRVNNTYRRALCVTIRVVILDKTWTSAEMMNGNLSRPSYPTTTSRTAQ